MKSQKIKELKKKKNLLVAFTIELIYGFLIMARWIQKGRKSSWEMGWEDALQHWWLQGGKNRACYSCQHK